MLGEGQEDSYAIYRRLRGVARFVMSAVPSPCSWATATAGLPQDAAPARQRISPNSLNTKER